ncbi:glycosyltransferase family 4 protein [Pseudomonas sp. 10S4]|uniref:glycosyltransferase family 4 protein n=2 Tax=unclassified Pseudomonas TaxID=196821 RepID=UPI002AC8BCEC|nr:MULTISPECIES: glycosyltransferase family 4 protein [unclassified Pseudomonas]MEB0224001.1 glycosyltransferase family 4 protein [Pseudomonas sp. 5S1]MEB0297319.1 glycosyltransferase family 4 protein [Pseudomonas sp. 10S4]WPX21240.1 glycosyltransferase family 4 protein [Pseudomonas sp. 10S4]
MDLLIVHQNFPGQFRHVALAALNRPGITVTAIGRDTAPGISGIKLFRYRPVRKTSSLAHPYLYKYEEAIVDGQQVFRILMKLKQEGYRPDVILAHPGWGETLFAKDVYPDSPLIHFCEYYYHSKKTDMDFDPEFPCATGAASSLRPLNSMHLLNLEQCDVGIAPTHWQRSLFPLSYQSKIHVIHEGIPFQLPDAVQVNSVTLPSGYVISAGQPIVTYVARNLEPYRGFHSFMRSIPYIQAQCPNANIVIVGGDGVSYGRKPVGYESWRSKMMAELDVDLSNIHFTGRLPYETYRAVLQLSVVHVYLTYPFVLSWSMLEAMASGCVVIGSDTAPVKEVVIDGVNGLLVDFFDSKEIARKVCGVLKSGGDFGLIRDSARSTAIRFDIKHGVKAYFDIFDRAISGCYSIQTV